MAVRTIRLAIAGVGNCASALLQGLQYYATVDHATGLMIPDVGGYTVTDIEPVAAFDINAEKVGKDLAEAIFAAPNNAYRLPDIDVPATGVRVQMADPLDGAPEHLTNLVKVADQEPVDVARALNEAGADVLLNCIPTGSARAAWMFARAALEAGTAFVNGMPELVVSTGEFAELAAERGIPVVGDDVKSQLGGTILHRALIEVMLARGIQIERTYQLNYAGNTDFLNLTHRGESKERTKREALTSLIPYDTEISPGFAYIQTMGDRKTTRFYFDLANFSGAPLLFDAKLEVEDSANFAGVAELAIRCCKLAQDRKIGGALTSASAFCSKHPPVPMPDEEALVALNEFVAGERER
jgi:myo-inositol-1-phosphate synthase